MAIILRPGRAARRAEWRLQAAFRARLEPIFNQAMVKELRRAGRDAARGFAASGRQGIDLAIAAHRTRLAEIIRPHHLRVMTVFGERVFDEAKQARLMLETKDAESAFTRAVQRWLAEHGATKVQQISKGTEQNILKAILAGEAEGEGTAAIARRITGTTQGTIGRARALVIARTETHQASNAANHVAAEALDIPDAKRDWLNAEDIRTRESHRIQEQGGQIRKLNEPFDIGGAKLLHPGDPAGPPAEIIACRCATALVIGGDE